MPVKSFLDTFGISASGMAANRLWLDLITNNIANLYSAGRPGDPGLSPYRRRYPVFAEVLGKEMNNISNKGGYRPMGVWVNRVLADASEPRLVHDPAHPYADSNGYVAYPNINVANEMVDIIAATRSFEANVTAFEATKKMAARALEISRT